MVVGGFTFDGSNTTAYDVADMPIRQLLNSLGVEPPTATCATAARVSASETQVAN